MREKHNAEAADKDHVSRCGDSRNGRACFKPAGAGSRFPPGYERAGKYLYINASIFGLGRKEIDRRIDDIIAFSELEQYMDNPVRTYSSGMYMRLAFSVAIHVNADILLVDEILAVGDVRFQAKCIQKLCGIKEQGTTIVLVSHSIEQIEQICERSIWIQDGYVRMDGSAKEVDREYLLYMQGAGA